MHQRVVGGIWLSPLIRALSLTLWINAICHETNFVQIVVLANQKQDNT